jgi:hypothetical protein
MIEAAMLAAGLESGSIRELEASPVLFPFKIRQLDTKVIEKNPRLELFRQRDEDMVAVRTSKKSA